MGQRLRSPWLQEILLAFMVMLSEAETPEDAVMPLNKDLQPVENYSLSFTSDLQPPVNKDLPSINEDLQPVTVNLQPDNDDLQPVTDATQPVTEAIQPVNENLQPVTEASQPANGDIHPINKDHQPVNRDFPPVNKDVYIYDYDYEEDDYRFREHLRPFYKNPNPFDDVPRTSDKVQQTIDTHPINKHLIPDCNMTRYDTRTLNISDGLFLPVIHLLPSSSITILTEENKSVPVDLLDVPKNLPVAARFDLKSKTFKLNISPFETTDLIFIDLNDTDRSNSSWKPMEMIFGNVVMSSGNCTTSLPYYPAEDIYAPTFTNMGRIEIILISKKEYGISDISGFMKGGEGFSICSDKGNPTIRRKWSHTFDECPTIQAGVPLYLTLSRNFKDNRTNINGVWLRDTKGAVEFFDGDYITIYCLYGCPSLSELNGTPGNTTKKGIRTCLLDTSTEQLVVIVAAVLFTLMAIDVVAMASDAICRRYFNLPPQQDLEQLQWLHRRYFNQPPQQDPEPLQWHLNTRPLPWAWQMPPPLPERPPPELPQEYSCREVGEEGEEEEEEEKEE